jgi:hypothetical protein
MNDGLCKMNANRATSAILARKSLRHRQLRLSIASGNETY